MEQLDRALLAVHAVAPLAEVVNGDDGGAVTGSPWDVWTRRDGALPSKAALRHIRSGGIADPDVEELRLSDPALIPAGGELSLLEVDKKTAPKEPVLDAPLAKHLATMEKAKRRGDRVVCVMDTPAGQVMYARTLSALDFELCLSREGRCHRVLAPQVASVDYERGRVDGTAKGVFLAADTSGRRIFELVPESGTRRVVFRGQSSTRGPWEVCRLGDRVVLSTSDGLTLLAWRGDELTPVAFAKLFGFKQITPLPESAGVLVCSFEGATEPEMRVASVYGDRLALGAAVRVKPAVLAPVVDGTRILVRQGRSLREVCGFQKIPAEPPIETDLPTATPTRKRRVHDGRPVISAHRVAGGELLIVDEIDRHAIILVRGKAREVTSPTKFGFPSVLDVNADGTRVLIGSDREDGFPFGEVIVEKARFQPSSWLEADVGAACYLANERLLWASSASLDVWSMKGQRVSSTPSLPGPATSLVATRLRGTKRRALVRTGNGHAVHLMIDGESIATTDLGLPIAEVFCEEDRLFATCDGVTYAAHSVF
jgi:hypothetical protein